MLSVIVGGVLGYFLYGLNPSIKNRDLIYDTIISSAIVALVIMGLMIGYKVKCLLSAILYGAISLILSVFVFFILDISKGESIAFTLAWVIVFLVFSDVTGFWIQQGLWRNEKRNAGIALLIISIVTVGIISPSFSNYQTESGMIARYKSIIETVFQKKMLKEKKPHAVTDGQPVKYIHATLLGDWVGEVGRVSANLSITKNSQSQLLGEISYGGIDEVLRIDVGEYNKQGKRVITFKGTRDVFYGVFLEKGARITGNHYKGKEKFQGWGVSKR